MATSELAVGSESRILTVPNIISLLRLASVGLFLWLLFGRHDRLAAAILLAALGTTDWVDGYIARRFNQVSTLGKILDPTADRILLGVGVVAIIIDGSVPAWVGWATVGREVLVSGAVVGLALAGAARIDVQWVGKAGTFGLMCGFPCFLAGHSGVSWHHWATALAWVCTIPGLILAWYAAATYVPLARRALAAGRQGDAALRGDAALHGDAARQSDPTHQGETGARP
ncbi:MAG: CDP-alcohol phosphatidyltransferase family protein [Acidimicrobiales bacterium]